MGDPFLTALERALDGKVEIMRSMTKELKANPDALAIPEVLRRAGERLRHFSETVETPLEQQFGDRLTAALPEAQPFSEKHTLAVDTFLSELQRLKYDEPYAGDPQIAAAVKEFEYATAHIPARTPG